MRLSGTFQEILADRDVTSDATKLSIRFGITTHRCRNNVYITSSVDTSGVIQEETQVIHKILVTEPNNPISIDIEENEGISC